MNCPLNHESEEWCIDCQYAKDLLCDWPHDVMESDFYVAFMGWLQSWGK